MLTAPLTTWRAARTETKDVSALRAIVRELRGVEQRRPGVLRFAGPLPDLFILLALGASSSAGLPNASMHNSVAAAMGAVANGYTFILTWDGQSIA